MSKLRIFYIFSLVILGVLVAVTVFHPTASGATYSQVQGEQLLEKDDQWIIEFHILNNEGQDTNYKINVLADGDNLSTDAITIRSGRVFKYIVHIYKDNLDKGEVSLVIYKGNETTPFEYITYYLK